MTAAFLVGKRVFSLAKGINTCAIRAVTRYQINRQQFRGIVDDALNFQLNALSHTEKKALAHRLLNETSRPAQSRLGSQGKAIVSVSRQEMVGMFVVTALPMLGFCFVDNFVMICAGEFLEFELGAAFALSTLAAAGLGNLVSDVVGLGAGGVIESAAARTGIVAPNLSRAQQATRAIKGVTMLGSIVGISLGCILGMCPLLFYDQESARLKQVFRRYDLNGDNSLSKSELKQAFEDAKVYCTDTTIAHMLDKYDTDESGGLDFAEFSAMCAEIHRMLKDDPSQELNVEAHHLMHATATAMIHEESKSRDAA
eukprot:m.124517 g.124517  ORF g.124517 m.124517 type:complete len:312 (+) comp17295_c1_seq1:337-1272(+)